MTTDPTTDLTALTAEIAASYVSHNRVATSEIAGLIQSVHEALSGLGSASAQPAAEPTYSRASTVRKSLADPNHIISMIDGKPYTMLTRHLRTHGLTPDQYRQRYGLPSDYPMTASAYSDKRRALAKALGLGRRAVNKIVEVAEPVVETIEGTKPKRTRKAAAPEPSAAPAKAPRKRRTAKATAAS